MSLAQQSCVPCEGGAKPLSAEQVHRLAEKISGWDVVAAERVKESSGLRTSPRPLSSPTRSPKWRTRKTTTPIYTSPGARWAWN